MPDARRAPSPVAPTRRASLRLVSGLALSLPWMGAGAAVAGRRLHPTPPQTEGPFYPVTLPADSDNDLLINGTRTYAAGERLVLSGRVVNPDGEALKGARVEIWQCDAAGHYHHPGDGDRADPAFQGFGRALVDANGHYSFRTMRPAAYTGRTPHIHLKVRLGARAVLTTQLYVKGDPRNERDALWRRLRSPDDVAALTVEFVAQADGSTVAHFPIVVPV